MSHKTDIIALITAQIPVLIMSLNNGVSRETLLTIVMIPLLIYFIQSIPTIFRYLRRSKIPKNYVTYYAPETVSDDYYIKIAQCLSVFLYDFYPETIREGIIKNFQESDAADPNIFYKCYKAIIEPTNNYYCKLSFMKNGENVIEAIKKTGFIFPSVIDIDKLLKYPIYLTNETIREEVLIGKKSDKKLQEMNKMYIKVSAIDIKTAQSFLYIIINYFFHKNNSITEFKLKKEIYFYDPKEEYNYIGSIVNVKKDYNNVFLTEKNIKNIVHCINEWENNKLKQLDRGIPNKISFLFYGKPGCGKTSLIYAIASETKKHIITINLQDMTNHSFMSLMSHVSNKIVVFEDIDAYKFTHKRDEENVEKKEEKKINELELSLLSNLQKNNPTFNLFKDMTLDVLLDVLDGYNYLNNCIVIMTSNHPEKLDPALIRPGRIDHKIEFDLCNEYQFNNMFKYFTGTSYYKVNSKFKFPENVFTTSYLINTIILPNCNTPAKILNIINTLK